MSYLRITCGFVAILQGAAVHEKTVMRAEVGAGDEPIVLAGQNHFKPKPLKEKCEYMKGSPQSSRPGAPCLPDAGFWPYKEQTEWRIKLGERILAAVTPTVAEDQCQGWHMFGDQTWCNKAFDGKHGKGVVGLSYGIEERDLWSETMSAEYKLPTKLFDCFIPLERSMPMSGRAPNGSDTCSLDPSGNAASPQPCYAKFYEAHRDCLGPQQVSVSGRSYVTLLGELTKYPKQSVHLKMDVEGSEWSVLEQLMDSTEDWDKIRTLDMEVHFHLGGGEAELPMFLKMEEQDQLERRVKVMERLREKMECTGSTLEVYRQGWTPMDSCSKGDCEEPRVYLPTGFSVNAFAVSYVHKSILDAK